MADQQTPALHAFRRSRAYRVGTLLRRLHLGLTVAVERGCTRRRSPHPVAGAGAAAAGRTSRASNAELAGCSTCRRRPCHQTLLRLEATAWSRAVSHPRLKRVQAHEVTAHGMALMERGSAVARVAIEAAMDGLSVAEQETLLGLLERSLAGLSEP